MTSPRFVVGVIGMIFNSGGMILGLKRAAKSQYWPGAWECVSGKVKLGEDPLEAVEREIKEECGIVVDVDPRPLDTWTGTYGDEPLILVCFGCTHTKGEVRLSFEHEEYAWLSIDEFEKRTEFPRLIEIARTIQPTVKSLVK